MKKNRIISAILVICMLITSFPLEILAVENNGVTNTFSDIGRNDWFYEDALYAYENNLFSGTSENTFSPNAPMTRAMYVTVIGRMENIDISVYMQNSTFIDVDKGSYYAPYVEWAKQMGITSGTGNDMFNPDKLITRQDMATFTTRFFDAYGYVYPDASDTTIPKDIERISSYARDSVLKLWSAGLLKGDQNGNFNPLKTATRAETAAFCSRIHRSENSEIQPSENQLPENIINNKKTSYEVKFETNGGGTIASQKLRSGVAMDNLPIPFKENSIFEGWYYDQDLKLPVSTTDTVKDNITLYAKYIETKSLKEDETPVFASALDQDTDFTIEVVSKQEMTADEVKNSIIAKNLSSTKQEDFISVKGSKKNFVIYGTNGFEEGATYKLTLDNENLCFEGYSDSVRDYNFTVAKEKTLNFSLNNDIVYIPASEIISITGKANAPITLNEGGISETAPSAGNFTYSGSTEIKVGDNIAIYEGTRPDLRTVDNDNDGDILYVKITGKSGNSYQYSGVEAEEVLFTPDVLPIPNNADTDEDTSNYSVTVSKDTLDFSKDIYQNIGLDSQTTIDVGDFISFYDGDFGYNMQNISYAKITDIKINEYNYVIEFESVTQDEMFASMDAYDTNQVSGEEMLENVNKAAIENNVEQQAINSGFAEEAALYLASLALKTDSFTELSSSYDLTDIQIKSKDGDDLTDGEIILMDGQKVEVDISKLQATLGTNLEYFDGYDGLRLTLEIGVEITIHASDKADIVIEVTGKFEQEVRIDINVNGGAIWKWWGPFPYISEYEATASVDLFDYTGIGIEATIITAEADDDDLTGMKDETINDIGKQLKDLMDAKDKYIGDGSGTVAEGLADKYKNMIENEDSEWVELFSEDIFKKEFNICLIIAVEVGVEFVVSANVNISLGMDFYYANAKRYVYTVGVFANNVTSDVIDITEEQYQFEFYVMGTLGLRAGIRAGIKVGLFTTTLASVGFTAEVGAYVRVWGYFYYQLRWTASQGKTTKYCGAMLFELGIYLEIKFETQAFNGTFSYNPTLYDNEWPLWYAGMRENIQDFSYDQEETPELSMKKTIQTTDVPDDIFEMEYMDLKTGEIETKVFDDETNFNIKMSNDAFSYNTKTNRLTVSPGAKSVQEGQMIITWITAPLAFTSAPIERRINLYWDNYNDGYSIAFNSNGGSSVPIIIQRYGGNVKPPEVPLKQGYIFDGWYSDAYLRNKYTVPSVMPDKDTIVYAKWTPATDTKYEVYHYKQDINGNYSLADIDTLSGTTDSTVTPVTKTYTGFASPVLQETVINPDGSTKINYYYKRNTYNVNFEPGEAGGEAVTNKIKYGASVTAPTFTKDGYEFTGWNVPIAVSMPAENITYTALWSPKGDIAYRVEHYVMQTDGLYKFKEFENKTGITDEIILANNLKKSAIEVENGITYSYATVKGNITDNIAVKSDGSLVIKLYYLRSEHNITFKYNNGESDTQKTLKYEEAITLPTEPTRSGYTFLGWYTDEACTVALNKTMPAKDVTAFAKWTASTNTPYKVEHYVMGTNGTYTSTPTYSYNLTGTTDTPFELSTLIKTELLVTNGIEYSHGEVKNKTETKAIVSGDGSLVVKLYYERKTYVLTWENIEGIVIGDYTHSGSIYFGSSITPPTLSRAGYTYVWDKIIPSTMPVENCTYTAVWTPNTNTSYKVEHYVMGTDGQYSVKPVITDNKSGTTDTMCILSDLKKDELLAPNGIEYSYGEVNGTTETQANISGDGSLVVKLYYERKEYTLTWEIGESVASGDFTQGGSIYYGCSVTPPTLTRAGYTYVWDETISSTMPAEDCTYTAVWTPNINTKYTVEHYQQNIADNNYTLKDRETLTGTTDSTAEAQSKEYDYFTLNPDAYGFLKNGKITGNGLLLLKLFYDRNKFKVTFDAGEGILGAEATQELKHGATVSTNDPKRSGYGFSGWYFDENCSDDERFNGIMPTNDITLYAKWVAGQVSYKVEHYVMDTSGYYPKIANVSENKTDFADAVVALADLKNNSLEVINGIELVEAEINNVISTSAAISADGTLVAKMFYERSQYGLFWDLDGGTADNNYTEGSIYYGAPIIIPRNLAKTGYTYEWDNTTPVTMPAIDLTYAAIWTANSYSVIFNSNDGTNATQLQDFMYDEEKSLTNNFERTGYTFSGWSTEANGEKVYDDCESVKNLTALQNGKVFLYAVWTPVSYTINYSTEFEGVGNSSYTIENEVTLPVLSHTGYTFGGWYDNSQYGGEAVTQIAANSTGDKSFFAKWTANSYSVIFNSNDGTNNTKTQNFMYDEEKSLTENTFERAGFTFSGWATEANGEKTYEDSETIKNLTAEQDGKVYLYAVWSPISYAITYNTKFESVENGSYTVENSVNLPVLSHTGYTFDGWYDNELYSGEVVAQIAANSTGDKSFYAKWNENKYTISFNSNGGNGEMMPQEFAYTEIKPLSANAFTRSGYTFSGWATEANGSKVYDNSQSVQSLTYLQNGNINIYAIWQLNTYDITYALNGGTVDNNPTQYDVSRGAITLNSPSRTGYTFGGWYTDEALVSKASYPEIAEGETGNKAFYAKWTANTYYVSFNANSGTGTMTSQSFKYDEALKTLTPNSFTLNGYNFKGWSTKPDGSGVSYADKMEVRNLSAAPNGTVTLYAQWTPTTYSISYNLYGGTNNLNNPLNYTIETATFVFKNPTHSTEGNVFAGWYTDSGFNNQITEIPTGSTGNIEVYAKWINCGKFSITNNGNNTFTISRTGGTDKAQTVYFRTLNGSAIGGTHFTHQENSIVLADGQVSVTVTIAENGANAMYNNNAATAYANANREYFVEIFDVSGGATLGSTVKARRTLTNNSSYFVSEYDMTNYKNIASVTKSSGGKSGLEVYESSGGGYKGTVNMGLNSNALNTTAYGNSLSSYISATADSMKVQLRNFKGTDDGWRMWRYVLFNTTSNDVSFSDSKNGGIPNLPGGTKAVLVYGISTDTDNSDSYSVNLPTAGTGTVTASGTSRSVTVSNILRASDQTANDYVLYGLNESVGISVGAYNSAAADSSWWFNSAELYTMPYDKSGPDYLGMAPMSNTSYKLGSKVTIALVFDEIIKSADGVSVLTNFSNNAFTLTGGAGTNVLYFEGTITNTSTSASVTTINNKTNIKDIFGNSAK